MWNTISDNNVRSIWKCTDEECDCPKETIQLSPTFYQDNGTPICDNGNDMAYIRTEVSINDLTIVESVLK